MSIPAVAAIVADVLTIGDAMDLRSAGREDPQVQALIEAARLGDREAFGDLVTLYQRVVVRTALAALGTREDAEDAAQDAFVMAWRKLRGFRGDASFKTWLLTITWRKALDRRRARRLWWQRTQWRPSIADHDLLAELTSLDADPERRTVSADLVARMHDEIRQLTAKLRDTLLLAATGEHSYDEISVMLGVPLGTVKWRVAEARRLVAERVNRSPREESESASAAARANGGGAPFARKK